MAGNLVVRLGRAISPKKKKKSETINDVINVINDWPDRRKALNYGLCFSCRDGTEVMWRFFVSEGADLDFVPSHKAKTEDRGLHPPIFLAVIRGNTELLNFLVASGASLKTRNYLGLTPLMAALKMRADAEVWQALLEHDAEAVNDVDGHGTTALMIAAATRNAEAVEELIAAATRNAPADEKLVKKKAVVNATDKDARNAFHYLASNGRLPSQDYEKVSGDVGAAKSILRLLKSCGVNAKATDDLKRSCLHWAATSRDASLLNSILETFKFDLEKQDHKFKTALHLAATKNNAIAADALLNHGADVNTKGAGGWTALHLACDLRVESIALVKVLCDQPADSKSSNCRNGADLEARTHTRRTALHIAARAGNLQVVEYLLLRSSAHRTVPDAFGDTPLLCAIGNPSASDEARTYFAPWSYVSPIEGPDREAAEKFHATIKDFSPRQNGQVKTLMRKVSVFDLIYRSHPNDPGEPRESIFPEQSEADSNHSRAAKGVSANNSTGTCFRWIHLPANDVSWCLDLLTKHFIESKGVNPERFRELSRSFNNQRDGIQPHSRFMTPTCKLVRRSAASTPHTKEPSSEVHPVKTRLVAGTIVPMEGSSAQRPAFKDRRLSPESRPQSPNSRTAMGMGGLYYFVPFLHQEYSANMASLRGALDCAANVLKYKSDCECVEPNEWHTLIRAHLGGSNPSLHIRRTLDQFFYQNMVTTDMDEDQVVQKYQVESSSNKAGPQQLLVVDQLWMWVVDESLIVTSFPQQWERTSSTALSTLDGIMELCNDSVLNVIDLAASIVYHTTGAYDRLAWTGDVLPPLLMFEGYIGTLMQRQQAVSEDFNKDSKKISEWLKSSKRFKDFRKEQLLQANDTRTWTMEDFNDPTSLGRFVGSILNIQVETKLSRELQDVSHELNILAIFLESQKRLLPSFQDAIEELWLQFKASDPEDSDLFTDLTDSLYWPKRFKEHYKLIEDPQQDIARLQAQVKEMTKSTQDLLELKAKLSNNIETRYAQEQAADNIRQGRTLMVFTIVTVIFLPLSFIAAFLAISIRELPHVGDQQSMTIRFVSRYMFGPGLGFAVFCLVLAFGGSDILDFIRKRGWKKILERLSVPKSKNDPPTKETDAAPQVAEKGQGSPFAQLLRRKPKQQKDVEHGQE